MARSSCNVELLPTGCEDQDEERTIALGQQRAFSCNPPQQCGDIGFLDGKRHLLRDFLDYQNAKAQLGDAIEEFYNLFKRFLAASVGGRCLRLLFDANSEPELGRNWVTVDLDKIERLARETGTLCIELEDEYFDAVLCTGLDRMSRPHRLIAEVKRVLKRAGQIWVQTPLNAPYLPAGDPTKAEYWRITPDGLRVLLEDFDEILCTVYPQGGSALRVGSFFYGLKSVDEPDDLIEVVKAGAN